MFNAHENVRFELRYTYYIHACFFTHAAASIGRNRENEKRLKKESSIHVGTHHSTNKWFCGHNIHFYGYEWE